MLKQWNVCMMVLDASFVQFINYTHFQMTFNRVVSLEVVPVVEQQ